MPKIKTRDMLLDVAAGKVAQMWKRVASSGITRANANDTIHFLHEEAGEVVKAAMQMGLMGGRQYVRSAEVEARQYTYTDLVMEVGDVLLMALTLAQAFGLDPSTCLAQSLRKFYARAAENEGKMVDKLRATIYPTEPTDAQIRQRDLDERIDVPVLGTAGALSTGLAIITADAKHRAQECEGFVPQPDNGEYCERCRTAEYLHGPTRADLQGLADSQGFDVKFEPPRAICGGPGSGCPIPIEVAVKKVVGGRVVDVVEPASEELCICGHAFGHHGERWPDDDHPTACRVAGCGCWQFEGMGS